MDICECVSGGTACLCMCELWHACLCIICVCEVLVHVSVCVQVFELY